MNSTGTTASAPVGTRAPVITRTAASGGNGSDLAMRLAAASGDANVMAALSQSGDSSSSGGTQALRLRSTRNRNRQLEHLVQLRTDELERSNRLLQQKAAEEAQDEDAPERLALLLYRGLAAGHHRCVQVHG